MIILQNNPVNIQKKFIVGSNEVHKCFDFAEELYSAKATSRKDHGNKGLEVRNKNDFIADNVRGKIAEFAFKQFLECNFKISFVVDLEIYPGEHNHDEGNDLSTIYINGEERRFDYKTDIKGLPKKGQWLLVESHKFWAQFFVVCRLNDIEDVNKFEENPFLYKNKEFCVSILGYCNNKRIVDKQEKTPRFKFVQNNRLYSSKVITALDNLLQGNQNILKLAQNNFQQNLNLAIKQVKEQDRYIGPLLKSELNYGYPVKWLRSDWQSFVKILDTKSSAIQAPKI